MWCWSTRRWESVVQGSRLNERSYARFLTAQVPSDLALENISRTLASDRVVNEFVVRFTHTMQMDWFAPGLAPTGRAVPRTLDDPASLLVDRAGVAYIDAWGHRSANVLGRR